MTKYTLEEVNKATLEYFRGDQLATDVWIKKYALKDKEGNVYELTPDDMHRRLARHFARIEQKYPNPMSEEEIYNLLKEFKYIVPGGSQLSGIGNDFTFTSLSNCFVIESAIDSYGGIFKADQEQVQIMKRRGGVGHDLSNLRPSGSLANNSVLKGMAGSTLYMERYSNSTREVSQGDRRGALMLSIDIRHPDTDKFIDAKLESGKVTGANISVKIRDEFMEVLKEDGIFYQRFPIKSDIVGFYDDMIKVNELSDFDPLIYQISSNSRKLTPPQYFKKIKSKQLWGKIVRNAHKSAEPGILFWDTILRESPANCYGEEWEESSTNPCIIGSTLIAVADGRNAISIEQLVKERIDVPVYATNPKTGKINIKWGRNPRKTKEKTEVWKLTLDDNTILIATPDHQIMLKDGSYCSLSKLKKNQSLKPFNTYLSEGSWNEGYRCVNSKSNGHSRQYRMIYEFFNGSYDGKLFNVHHKDETRLNDFPGNLELVNAKNHRSEHKLGEKNPYYTHENVRELLRKNGSHPGATNPKYINISNEEIIEEGRKCFEKNNHFSKNVWEEFVSKNEKRIPNVSSKFRFGSFSKFKSCVIDNHKVKSVEFYGYEDVYNITVDDYHNYNIITSGDDKYIRSSGITIKNCGEIPLCPYDSCRLTALNLYSYVEFPFTSQAKFNLTLFKDHVRKAQRIMDDLIDLEIEKIEKIIEKVKSDPEPEEVKQVELNLWIKIKEKAEQGRRTGLGITAEGDMLAALGLRYGTQEATEFSVEVHKTMAVESYKSSIEMAKERGSFPIFDGLNEAFNPFIGRVIYGEILHNEGGIWINDYQRYGRRNIANLTIAPTGSLSILTQTTSGVEPLFASFYKRRRKTADSKVDFIDEKGDKWEEYFVFHKKFVEWFEVNYFSKKGDLFRNETAQKYLEQCDKNLVQKYFEESPYYQATANDVDWKESVKMQGDIQKWIDHSISKTINLPKGITVETVDELYRYAHEVGCKGVTVYVDGSRDGVLITEEKEKKQDRFEYTKSFKRPQSIECDIYHKTALKKDWMILVGLVNGNPYEIFGLNDQENHVFLKKIEKGILTKVKSRTYKLEGIFQGKTYVIDNIISLMSDDEKVDTRKYSSMLRHGMHPQFVSEQIEEYASISSFDKVVSRTLKNYISKEDKKEKCPECGSDNYHAESGCYSCPDCGYAKCG